MLGAIFPKSIMPTDAAAGFLTRPEAAKLYNRSQRALERDLDQALLLGDHDVLDHYKLITKDGQARRAHEVTVEAVKALVAEGMTPVWYVEESWLEQEYGKKGSPRPRQSRESPATLVFPPRTEPPGDTADGQHPRLTDIDPVAMLREQLHKQDREIEYLRQELKIKNEQIAAANERTRESNVLMRELQKMLGSWQEQAFRSLPAATRSPAQPMTKDSRPDGQAKQPVAAADDAKADTDMKRAAHVERRQPLKQGTAGSRRTHPHATDAARERSIPARRPQPPKTVAAKPKWYEMPALKRIFRRP